jgi:hypothetical protein
MAARRTQKQDRREKSWQFCVALTGMSCPIYITTGGQTDTLPLTLVD